VASEPISSEEGLKEFYDDPAVVESYLEKRTGQPFNSVLHERQVRFLNRVIATFEPGAIFDLAPGPARLGAELDFACLGAAMDASANMLALARARNERKGKPWLLVRGDAFHLPFRPGSFDLVYSLRFVRRFALTQREKLYSEIRRVLRPGGHFAMDAQNRLVALPHRLARGLDKYPVYDELFLRHELVEELEGNGFRVLELEPMMRRFTAQFRLNRLRRFGLGRLARLLIKALEFTSNGNNPSTWMALCERRD